ncbi:MAG TPA: cyclic lactone autoinducer peptide [Bacillota bacterium]|nr:cyclic lactone autoinducer peptide [Bacillota bacterium]
MKKLSASLVIFLATVLSMLSICSACSWFWHQPDVPQKPQ